MATGETTLKSTANRLAAIAVFLNEAILVENQGLSPSAVAALLVMAQAEEMSIGGIADAVQLTHSAAVRLVDRLESDWLLRRRRRAGREVFVEVTALGRRRARELSEVRMKRSADFLGALSEEQLESLNKILKLTIDHQGTLHPNSAKRLCRMCDRGACQCQIDVAPK